MNVHDMNPHIRPTPVYRIEVHARLLILKRNSHLHGLILVSTFIILRKFSPLHIYDLENNSNISLKLLVFGHQLNKNHYNSFKTIDNWISHYFIITEREHRYIKSWNMIYNILRQQYHSKAYQIMYVKRLLIIFSPDFYSSKVFCQTDNYHCFHKKH